MPQEICRGCYDRNNTVRMSIARITIAVVTITVVVIIVVMENAGRSNSLTMKTGVSGMVFFHIIESTIGSISKNVHVNVIVVVVVRTFKSQRIERKLKR